MFNARVWNPSTYSQASPEETIKGPKAAESGYVSPIRSFRMLPASFCRFKGGEPDPDSGALNLLNAFCRGETCIIRGFETRAELLDFKCVESCCLAE